MTGSTSETSAPAASKPVLGARAALAQLAKCLSGSLLIAAVVFLGFSKGEILGGVFAPIGQLIASTMEFLLSALALVAAYHPGGLLTLGMAFAAGCVCYFLKTDNMTEGSAKKIDTLAQSVGWAGVAGIVLAVLGSVSYPANAIRYFNSDPSSLSTREHKSLLGGLGGDTHYMNCRRIAGAYLSASAKTQQHLAVEVNGVKVKVGQQPAKHCRMFSFNKVLYGYENSDIFARNRASKPD